MYFMIYKSQQLAVSEKQYAVFLGMSEFCIKYFKQRYSKVVWHSRPNLSSIWWNLVPFLCGVHIRPPMVATPLSIKYPKIPFIHPLGTLLISAHPLATKISLHNSNLHKKNCYQQIHKNKLANNFKFIANKSQVIPQLH